MTILLKPSPPTGLAIPPNTPHSVLNSLPEWDDNIMIVQGRGSEILKETTYPRFNIHPCVEELTAVIVKAIDANHQGNCFLFPTFLLAQEFRSYIQVNFSFSSCDVHCATEIADAPSGHQIFAALFSAEERDARKFYIFSGNGISPRLAEVCLQRRGGNPQPPLSLPSTTGHCFGEYYSRHTPLDSAEAAKRVIRNRFSGMVDGGSNIRGVPAASPEDVYLFSSGMQAIWRVYNLLAGTLGSRNHCRLHKVAHVNLLYCDSYKFLELPNSAGYHFFTNDTMDELESLLATGTPDQPAILALYTDFPGNPHLRSADLVRLRVLADRYNIPIIVDETAGGYLNTQTLPYCDIVVSSLTKLFSGMANVLGGAMILNPAARFYPEFKKHMEATYEDCVFDHDALLLEMHSREYAHRTAITSHNAEMLSDMLHSHSVDGGSKTSVLKAVHYPKYRTRDIYDRYRNPLAEKAGLKETGYGNLLSVTFTSVAAAKAFYCALQCYKGATLGTVFTLATAFSAIAFPPEKMQWIEDRGVEESLIRFSVGMEDTSSILKCVLDALLVAQRVQNAVEPMARI